jgi:hypothetical protein
MARIGHKSPGSALAEWLPEAEFQNPSEKGGIIA